MTRAQQIARTLQSFGGLFYLLGGIAALGAFAIGYQMGTIGLTQFERDAGIGWRLTESVWVWWGIAVGIVVQAVWLAQMSVAVSILLGGAPEETPRTD
jgi:hypothetical protein